jgi:glucose/arabinose dehydrogenase
MPRTLGLAAWLAACVPAFAQWPANFVATAVADNWQQPVGLTFAEDGRMIVWEKAGRVWTVENGVKSAAPLLDISAEVGDWRDHGLLGLALDPDFLSNGRLYLSYVVDWHHLEYFGTPQYSPTANVYFRDTIGRITRYTANSADGFRSVDPQSRFVLVGESKSTGIPIAHQSHGVGALVFGADGALLAGTGDGASYLEVDIGQAVSGSSNTALAEGILKPKEAVGAWRSQLVDSLSGKLLRLDPNTGNGWSNNPFFDASAPRAPRSRVWALGLRNPFRFAHLPGTGHAHGSHASPGTLVIGDVGWNSFEEFSLSVGGGENFGWPLFEGLTGQSGYAATSVLNLDAPNPLAGAGCATHFRFQDLLVQATPSAPSWPNPCDPGQQAPASLWRFQHERPWLEYGHGNLASTGVFASGAAERLRIDDPLSPVQGEQFDGACPGALAWCSSSNYPAPWRDTLFIADYVGGWVKSVEFGVNGAPSVVRNFAPPGAGGAVVAMAAHPQSGDLYFIDYGAAGQPSVRHLQWIADQIPVAVASPAQSFGPSPLSVQFSSAGSYDPENLALTYLWDFGDGTTSTAANPSHVYESLEDVSALGQIVARVYELTPPGPLGGGNPNPEIIRDGDFPPLGSLDSSRQFDTFHFGDQGALDWIGYALPAPRAFRRVLFQEGRQFADGGWFNSLRVEVGNGSSWTPVTGLSITPLYGGANGLGFEIFQLDFDAASGTQIRIAGAPGGSARFISVAELRVFASPIGSRPPLRFDVTLTVTDPLGGASIARAVVSTDNTPPQVAITSPLDGSYYPITSSDQVVQLHAQVSDAEHGPSELECAWRTTLFHDDHNHPEPLDFNCTSSTVITPVGCDGQTYWYEIELTVTDAAGLSTRAVSRLEPDCCQGGPPPTSYCTAKLSSLGCLPAIASSGTPSVSSGAPFLVTCTNVPSQRLGLMMYSFSAADWPFLGGRRCVATPVRRTPAQASGGSLFPACDGAFAFDFNAWRLTGSDSNLSVGRLVFAQYWFRDSAASFGAGLSDGLQFALCP